VKLLEGRVALVTGGSRGLGRAIAKVFAREGAFTAFCYSRSETDAQHTLQEIQAVGEGRAFRVSVLDKEGLKGICKEVEAQLGQPIDTLVNNAGIGQVVPLALMEEEDWDRMMDTHVKGAFLATQAVLRGMVRIKKGHVLNIGSLAGVKMLQAPVHYATAKAALKGFTESLAKEVARYGIRVNCLAPGLLEEGVSDNLPAYRREEFLKHCALGRLGQPSEVAELAAFMVSDRNSYMSGATVVVDGAV
jgi:NAD(P)-dependent dehydrogenase (short-subunit alcohol dehydrogenase family)